jgi:hypothetical protein
MKNFLYKKLQFLKYSLMKIPYFLRKIRYGDIFNSAFPPGHYHSPIPSLKEIKQREEKIFLRNNNLPEDGIKYNKEAQLDLLHSFSDYYGDDLFSKDKKEDRYFYGNVFFRWSDAFIFQSMIRKFQPRRIIEIGSGFSSALSLDTNDLYMNKGMDLTFIEPNASRLKSILRKDDEIAVKIIEKSVQDVDEAVFKELQENDILFIDSSHISKIGSDLNFLLFEILPQLASGVIIHFHDIFYPFEYPKSWIMEGRAWNECYLVKAFLQHNECYDILFFTNFMNCFYDEWMQVNMPMLFKSRGNSLWIKKQ